MSLPSQMLTDHDEGKKLANIAISKITREDIIHRGFLKPIEVALKVHELQPTNNPLLQHPEFLIEEQLEPQNRPNSLPTGLKIAVKNSICDNRFVLKDLYAVQTNSSYQSLKENNQDNLLSLMKCKQGLQLAICVCMYSEDKKMLKNTLAGISENIVNLITQQGIDPDKIGVFVLMDGIQKVNSTVVDYFTELERSNHINLGENLPPSLTMSEMERRANLKTEEEINQEQFRNVNNFLFNYAELKDRNERSFPNVSKEYQQIKQLLKTVGQLKKKKALFDDLPSKARQFFFTEARELKKKLQNLTDKQAKWIPQATLIEQFTLDIRVVRPIIIRALQECERYCKEYLQSREDLAYLAIFKNKIKLNIVDEEQSENSQMVHSKTTFLSEGTDRKIVDSVNENCLTTSMNLFLCVKYKNSGKLSSHNWFFNGFCKQLKPKYSILLDVGLKPDGLALLKMYKYMKKDDKIGGVCGYMSLKIEQLEQDEQAKLEDHTDCVSKICLKFADIQRTQQVQYHFAHLMDKAFQSSFGFIHVLPGAFSAYNMQAILDYDSTKDDALLRSYFKSIDEKLVNNKIIPTQLTLSNILLKILLPDLINRCFVEVHPESEEQMLYNENIYLAEDRILCMGIHKKGYLIKFLPDAYAEVDPIKTVHGLLGQRKRWINGSFFAFEKVKKQLQQHEEKSGIQICLNLQILYLTLMNSLAYFAPSFFLFTVHIAMDAFKADVLTQLFSGFIGDPNNSPVLQSFVYTMDFIYVLLIGCILYYSLHLTNNHKNYKPYIYAISTIFGILAISVFVVLVVDVFRGLLDNAAFLIQNKALIEDIPGGMTTIDSMRWILIGSTLIFCVPILAYAILFQKINIACEIMMGAFSFIFYGPTYLNILNIYSLCRIDDISWGTKGLDSESNKKNAKLKDKWYLLKMVHVGKFILWNIVLSGVLLSVGSSYKPRFFITIIMVSVIALTLGFKIFIALIYMIAYKIESCCCKPKEVEVAVQHLKLGRQERIERLFDLYYQDIMDQVKTHLFLLAHKYNNNNYKQYPLSFVQLSKAPDNVEMSIRKHMQDFVHRSKLDQRLSDIEIRTDKRSSNNYNIMALNQYNLPIQTKNALDVLSQLEKKNSRFSMDKRNSNPFLQKRNSQQSIQKNSFPFSRLTIDKKSSLKEFEKKSSSNNLQKKTSFQMLQRKQSKSDLDKKPSSKQKISPKKQISQQQQQKLKNSNGLVSISSEKPYTIGQQNQENESQEQSFDYLKTQMVKVNPKKVSFEQAKASRFKPEEK